MTREYLGHPHVLAALVMLGMVVSGSGCGQLESLLETKVIPVPIPPPGAEGLPQAYARSQINDPSLQHYATQFETWALQWKPEGANPAPVFSRVEVLPPTRTVLPYGVGAYQQESRLPVILTVGPAWARQNDDAKEAIAAQVFRRLARGLEALQLDPPIRPTLTIQTPSGLELAWINDLVEGRRNIHGDDSPSFPSTAAGSSTPPPSAPPPPVPAGREKRIDGDEP